MSKVDNSFGWKFNLMMFSKILTKMGWLVLLDLLNWLNC